MAQVYSCRLTRSDPSSSWGFRLQGGKDFGTPLLIQKVSEILFAFEENEKKFFASVRLFTLAYVYIPIEDIRRVGMFFSL